MSDLFNPELYVSDVSVYYGSKCAVQNVSFNIHPGQLTAIIGNNGCGKSSLIRAVMNLVKHSGKCMLGELQLENMSVRKRAGMISYIPQRTGISISIGIFLQNILRTGHRLRTVLNQLIRAEGSFAPHAAR